MVGVNVIFIGVSSPPIAIMVDAGIVQVKHVKALVRILFAPIPAGTKPLRNLPAEPQQTEARLLRVERDVPANAIHKVYHMVARGDERYNAQDLLSDVLGRGTSSRFYRNLIQGKTLFKDLSAYVSGNADPGLFVISGKLKEGVSFEEADAAICSEIEAITQQGVSADELEKVKNKAESTLVFGEMGALNKAMNLAFAELMGDANLVNLEQERIRAVTAEAIQHEAAAVLHPNNCSTLYYVAKA